MNDAERDGGTNEGLGSPQLPVGGSGIRGCWASAKRWLFDPTAAARGGGGTTSAHKGWWWWVTTGRKTEEKKSTRAHFVDQHWEESCVEENYFTGVCGEHAAVGWPMGQSLNAIVEEKNREELPSCSLPSSTGQQEQQ